MLGTLLLHCRFTNTAARFPSLCADCMHLVRSSIATPQSYSMRSHDDSPRVKAPLKSSDPLVPTAFIGYQVLELDERFSISNNLVNKTVCYATLDVPRVLAEASRLRGPRQAGGVGSVAGGGAVPAPPAPRPSANGNGCAPPLPIFRLAGCTARVSVSRTRDAQTLLLLVSRCCVSRGGGSSGGSRRAPLATSNQRCVPRV